MSLYELLFSTRQLTKLIIKNRKLEDFARLFDYNVKG